MVVSGLYVSGLTTNRVCGPGSSRATSTITGLKWLYRAQVVAIEITLWDPIKWEVAALGYNRRGAHTEAVAFVTWQFTCHRVLVCVQLPYITSWYSIMGYVA